MRRAYKKPQVKKVKLTPQDAVLTGCKTSMNGVGGGKKCSETGCTNRLAGS